MPTGPTLLTSVALRQSYFERQQDPAKAIDDILNIEDFDRFVEQSGYASKFE